VWGGGGGGVGGGGCGRKRRKKGTFRISGVKWKEGEISTGEEGQGTVRRPRRHDSQQSSPRKNLAEGNIRKGLSERGGPKEYFKKMMMKTRAFGGGPKGRSTWLKKSARGL